MFYNKFYSIVSCSVSRLHIDGNYKSNHLYGNYKSNHLYGNYKSNHLYGNYKSNHLYGNYKSNHLYGNLEYLDLINNLFSVISVSWNKSNLIFWSIELEDKWTLRFNFANILRHHKVMLQGVSLQDMGLLLIESPQLKGKLPHWLAT